jgi:hypothetical protein
MSRKSDQTQGIRHAAEMKRKITIARAKTALNELQQQKKIINFNTVAKQAGISSAWLYKNMKDEIGALREQSTSRHQIKQASSAQISKASHQAVIYTLKNKIKDLENANKQLKQQIELLYGQLACKE